jgi:malate dehydrogenase (quinone)
MVATPPSDCDVILIGAGIMSATLGVFLKELAPSTNIAMLETLEDCGLESSEAWNKPAPATPPIAR